MDTRAEGLIKITDLRKLKKVIQSIRKDLLPEGYDRYDIENILMTYVRKGVS